MKPIFVLLISLLTAFYSFGQKPRAREIGIPFDGVPGKYNSITDVQGVEVGYSTIISGTGANELGEGPVRTGVTAIFPRGKAQNLALYTPIGIASMETEK